MAEPSLLTEITSPAMNRGQTLLVRLLLKRRGQAPFELDHAPATEAPPPSSPGWIERRIVAFSRKLDALSSRWTAQQEKMPSWAKRMLERIQAKPPLEEELLRSLCSAELVQIEFPGEWQPRRAVRRWRHLLHAGRAHHLLRAFLWGLLIPPALLLTVIPGPNVLGFYFSYRALAHALAWLGAGRALKGSLPVAFTPR